MLNFDSEDIPDTTKSYAHLIPLSKVTPDLEKWNFTSFPAIEINSQFQPWLDVYFERVNSRFPILSESFVRDNLSSLPMFLLHAMYALTLGTTITEDSTYSPGDYHYSHCKLLFETNRHEPNPLFVVATTLLSFYQMLYTSAVVGGISMLSVAIRFSQEMRIFQIQDFVWLSDDGKEFGVQMGTSKRLLQMISYFQYDSDIITSFLRRLPVLTLEENLDTLLEFIPDEGSYNSFYDSNLWRNGFELNRVIGRIVSFTLEPVQVLSNEWIAQVVILDKQLLNWKDNSPNCMKSTFFSYNTAYSYPSFYSGYQFSMYNLFRIILYKPIFLMSLSKSKFDDPVVEICKQCAENMVAVLMALEVHLDKVPILTYYHAYIFGTICVLLNYISPSKCYQAKIEVSLRVLKHFATMIPQINNRIERIKSYQNSTFEKAIAEFGGFR